MNLRHIEVFHAIYKYGSASAAARALNISQPSITKILRHTESLIGFRLFELTKGRLVPTADAHVLFNDVQDIQERVYALRQVTRNLRLGRTGTSRISVIPALGFGILPSAVDQFRRRHGDAAFDLEIVHHHEMVRALYEHETDIVVGNQVPPTAPVAHDWLGEGELVLLYREQDMPNAPPRLDLKVLEGKPFIGCRPDSAFGRLLYAELTRRNVMVDEISSVRTFYPAVALVRAGAGMAVVDNFTAAALSEPDLSYRPLQPILTFDIHAIYLQSRPPSKVARQFLAILREEIDKL